VENKLTFKAQLIDYLKCYPGNGILWLTVYWFINCLLMRKY